MKSHAAVAFAVALALLALSPTAHAQATRRVHRIGYLDYGSPTSSERRVTAFRAGLRELGWIEGQNVVIDYRFAEGRIDRLPDLAAELVRLGPDVIAAGPRQPVDAATKATRTIPIVMIAVGDPVGTGLVASLAHPGGNVTGSAYGVGLDTLGKGLELLTEAVPGLRRVALLTNPTIPSTAVAIDNVRAAARSLRVELRLLDARGREGFDRAFAAMAKERVGALLVVADPAFTIHRARLVELAARHRLPSLYTHSDFVEAGGLMSYGPSLADLWRRAAIYVDKILKGARPADLPVEQPAKFELVINLKTARTFGLTIPPSLRLRADQVID